jgi:hypothetical protein
MENKHRIANLKAILRETRKDLRRHRLAAREASNTLRELFRKVKDDPAMGHHHYSQIGVVSVDKERAKNAAYSAERSVFQLRMEIRDLLSK